MALGISLAQWSLHRAISSGRLRGLDLPRTAREQFGLGAVELVSTLLEETSSRAFAALRRQADDLDVRILLVMVDEEGDLSAPDPVLRREAVARHERWLDAAAALGCHAIRVNTGGGDATQAPGAVPAVHPGLPLDDPLVQAVLGRFAESCGSLCDAAARRGLSVLVENHGGLSSHVPAVLELVRLLGRENFGTLPDFGNFPPGADPGAAVETLMPYARAVSAKCFDFDREGNETTIDYPRLIDIVRRSGYEGFLGIEYEGERLSEEEGVRACRRLLERLLDRAGSGAGGPGGRP